MTFPDIVVVMQKQEVMATRPLWNRTLFVKMCGDRMLRILKAGEWILWKPQAGDFAATDWELWHRADS